MKYFDKLDKHADLMGKMSEKVGVSWPDLVADHPGLAQQFREAILTCTHCKDVGECKSWQKTHDHADNAPDYCLNKDLLAELAKM